MKPSISVHWLSLLRDISLITQLFRHLISSYLNTRDNQSYLGFVHRLMNQLSVTMSSQRRRTFIFCSFYCFMAKKMSFVPGSQWPCMNEWYIFYCITYHSDNLIGQMFSYFIVCPSPKTPFFVNLFYILWRRLDVLQIWEHNHILQCKTWKVWSSFVEGWFEIVCFGLVWFLSRVHCTYDLLETEHVEKGSLCYFEVQLFSWCTYLCHEWVFETL